MPKYKGSQNTCLLLLIFHSVKSKSEDNDGVPISPILKASLRFISWFREILFMRVLYKNSMAKMFFQENVDNFVSSLTPRPSKNRVMHV